ncbi:MAG: putative hydro-lyase [Planctomycetota bacterium]|nr:putative hydro-lyase [Planctomycetota bacterium]
MRRALGQETALSIRQLVREGRWSGSTAGAALDHVQANLVILSRHDAEDFLLYCEKNPKPCPLLAVSDPGDPYLKDLGEDLDVRTDVPVYEIFERGERQGETGDIRHLWTSESVAFALGCSFSFERALMEAGLPIRHIENRANVPMYRTGIDTHPVGEFSGKLVVSMRPFAVEDLERVREITSCYSKVHGAPVHVGDPADIGIRDLAQQDYGGVADVREEEVPVFWACGVTPQLAIASARPRLSITHKPGHMLVTDLLNKDLEFA